MRGWQYHLEWPQLNNHHFDDAMACNGTAWHSFSSKVSAWSTAFRDFKADTHRIAVASQILCSLQQISITDPTATHCQVSWTHVQQAVSDVSDCFCIEIKEFEKLATQPNYLNSGLQSACTPPGKRRWPDVSYKFYPAKLKLCQGEVVKSIKIICASAHGVTQQIPFFLVA